MNIPNVNITDIQESVKVGESCERLILDVWLESLNKNLLVVKHPPFSQMDFDLINLDDNSFFAQVEVKIREPHYDDTAVEILKENVALNDYVTKKKITYLIVYTKVTKEVRVYDMINRPPLRRDYMTRKDRDVTKKHSFYNTPVFSKVVNIDVGGIQKW